MSLQHSNKQITLLTICLNVLARQYKISLAAMIRKLDRVSGDIKYLQQVLKGNNRYEWTPEEDKLLGQNEGLLVRWKSKEVVELRKKYINNVSGKQI